MNVAFDLITTQVISKEPKILIFFANSVLFAVNDYEKKFKSFRKMAGFVKTSVVKRVKLMFNEWRGCDKCKL